MAKGADKASKVDQASNEPVIVGARPERKKRRKILGKVAIWIFATAVIATPNLLYSQAGIGFSPVLTDSMSPVSHAGDVMLTKTVQASTLKVGDIISVYNQIAGTYYSHRIVEIKTVDSALKFFTKGDANKNIDAEALLVPPIAEISKEYMVLPPMAGHAAVYLWSPRGHQVSSIFLVTTYVIIIFLFLFRKKIIANLRPEKVYKELYSEERTTSEHYKNVINHLKEIEMEREAMKNSR